MSFFTENPASNDVEHASDAITGVHHQAVKVEFGAAGNATFVSSGTPFPVTIISSALPTGAATEATLSSVDGLLTTIDADTGSIATDTATVAGAVSGTEMQVDVVTSALPAGAATAANQSTANGHLSTLAGAVDLTEMQVDVITSALPTGAATSANQSTANNLLTTIDADTGSMANDLASIDTDTGTMVTHLTTIAGAISGSEAQVDVITSALPTGAATAANQSTANGHLSTLAGAVAGTELQVDIVTIPGTVPGGNVAHDAIDSGNPVKIGGVASNVERAVVASGDRTELYVDTHGRLVCVPFSGKENYLHDDASATDTSDTTVIAAQGAGVKINVTSITVMNTSTTEAHIIIKDGATEIKRLPAPENSRGGHYTFPTPIPLTANTALRFASSSAVSTMYVSATGYAGA